MNEPVVLAAVALAVKSVLQTAWLCLGRAREQERDRTLLRLARAAGKGGWVADRRNDGRVLVVWMRGAEGNDYQSRNKGADGAEGAGGAARTREIAQAQAEGRNA